MDAGLYIYGGVLALLLVDTPGRPGHRCSAQAARTGLFRGDGARSRGCQPRPKLGRSASASLRPELRSSGCSGSGGSGEDRARSARSRLRRATRLAGFARPRTSPPTARPAPPSPSRISRPRHSRRSSSGSTPSARLSPRTTRPSTACATTPTSCSATLKPPSVEPDNASVSRVTKARHSRGASHGTVFGDRSRPALRARTA